MVHTWRSRNKKSASVLSCAYLEKSGIQRGSSSRPNVCRMNAVLPIAADTTYEYPLCKVLAKENCARRFDSVKYDEHNGEITYEYSFLTRHGIFKDDLETYFYAVVGSAVSCYDDIRKCSVGRYKSKEANEIIQKVNAIVSDIKE